MGMLRKTFTLFVFILLILPGVFAIYGGGEPSTDDDPGDGGSSGGGGGGGSTITNTTVIENCVDECSPLGKIECLEEGVYRSCSFITGCKLWATIKVPSDKECTEGKLYPKAQPEPEQPPEDVIYEAPEGEARTPTGTVISEGLPMQSIGAAILAAAVIVGLVIFVLKHKKESTPEPKKIVRGPPRPKYRKRKIK